MINVILADHERIFRIGMAAALAAEDDIRIVGQPTMHDQLMHGIENFRPQVLVLSSAFLGPIDSIRQSCLRMRTAILLLQDYGTKSLPEISSDFEGVVRRSADQRTVVECVRHLARGGRVVRLTPDREHEVSSDAIGVRVRERMTHEELTIVSHIVRGFKNREIALRLGTTEQSVKNSLRKIFDKTGVYGRLELALFVLHHRTLAGTSVATSREARITSMASLQRYWNASRSLLMN
jgi:DNA-binding NarL/FixJ family response regulator